MEHITQTTPGTWLIYKDTDPVAGIAVWQYSNGIFKCEQCGIGKYPINPVNKKDCHHIDKARRNQGTDILKQL